MLGSPPPPPPRRPGTLARRGCREAGTRLDYPHSCAFLPLPDPRPSRKKTARDRIVLSATVPTPTTMPALPCLLPSFAQSAGLAHAPEAGQVLAGGVGSAPQGFSANHVVPGISCSSGSCVTLCPGLTQYFFFFNTKINPLGEGKYFRHRSDQGLNV